LNEDGYGGLNDRRLPNRWELRSLMGYQARKPALPAGHPFEQVQEAYWASTTSFCETDWARVLYLHKGACGVGYKPEKAFHVWPVTSLAEAV